MVAKIVNSKSIRGILNYNENKIANAEAELLLAAGFPRDNEQLSFKNKLERFTLLTQQNQNTKTNAMHIMLNFSNRDTLDNELLKSIAMNYMDKIGFGHQPFLVYRHYDAAHPHIHIATVNIQDGGNRIETHNIGRNQSEKARKEIEEWYGLIKAEDQPKDINYTPQPVVLNKAIYGKSETKAAISSIVRDVTGSYKFTSLPELNAILGQFNIRAYRGSEDSTMYKKGGLVYQILDNNRQPIGIPIKASSIFSSPTIKNLEKKYPVNATSRKPFAQRLRYLLDKAIANSSDLEQLKVELQKQGIRILFRENDAGQVYGVTFIDNATRAVFNGSDLGKNYSAKLFLERLPKTKEVKNQQFDNNDTVRTSYPANDLPVIQRLIDAILTTEDSDSVSDPFKRKKKKRLQAD
jgi:hypothetical protein